MNQIACVLLMGGRSSRMGQDKAYLDYCGVPFWKQITDEMYKCGETYLSVNSTSNIPDTNYSIIIDEYENIGPIGGIYSSLNSIKESIAFFAPCDIPTITAEFIQAIIDQYEEKYDGVIVASKEGKCYPTIGVYSKKIRKQLLEQMKQKDYRLMNLIQSCNVKVFSEQDLQVNSFGLMNLNTPEEYEAKKRQWKI